MAAFGQMILTNKGRVLQAKAQTGAALQFTAIKMGDGNLGGQSIPTLNGLISQKLSLSITRLTQFDGKATIGAYLSNSALTTGFFFREFGVFANDPDVGEILYCYANAGATAEYIPAGGGPDIVEKYINTIVIVQNAANVSAVINESLVLTPNTRKIIAGAGLAGGGDLSQDRTITIAMKGVSQDKIADKAVGSGQLADGAATDTIIGNRTVNDATAPTGDTGTVTNLFGWLANMIKAITGKSNWRTAPAMSLETAKQSLDSLSAKLTDANTQTTPLTRGQNLITASEAGPVAVTIKGNTVVNLLGNLGSGESLSGYTGSSGIKGIATSPARSGSSFSFSPSATTNSYIYQDLSNLILDKSKYYLLSGWMYIESIAAGVSPPEISLRDIGTFSVRYQTGASANTVGAWQYVSIRIPANNTLAGTGLRLLIGCGAQGQQVAYVDEVSLNEITAEEYQKMGTGDPNYIGEKLAARIPFVSDGVKHITNPVITKVGKNLIGPYPTGMHPNAKVTGPYEVTLNATGAMQDAYFEFSVPTNTVCTVFVPNNMRYAIADNGSVVGYLGYGTGVRQFNSGAKTTLRLYFSSESSTSGTFVWRDFIVAIGAYTELIFEPRNDDYLYALTTLIGIGDVKDVLTVRGTEATALRRMKEITVDGSSTWQFSSDYAGSKSVRINNFNPSALSAGVCVGTDHRGMPIGTMFATGIPGRAIVTSDVGAYSLFLNIEDALTGWGETYTPTVVEMSAYFYGWRMNNGTFGTAYNGTGTKTWTRWDATSNTGAVTTVPTTMAEGYTPYKLSYQLATPVTEVVPVEGSLANHVGANLYEVSEGVIVREKVVPRLSSGKYLIIGNAETRKDPGWGLARTLFSISKFYQVYKNSEKNNGWTLTTFNNVSIDPAVFDTSAEYTITYLAMDKYAITAPVAEGALEYKNNLAGVLSETVKQMADNNTIDNIQNGRLLLDEAYIRNFNMDLSGATNAATASTLMKRDASGRAQVVTPSAAADIANKGYVDTAIAGATIPDATLTAKGKVQLSSATNSTSEALAATPKAVKDAYDRGSAGVSAAATAQTKADNAYSRADQAFTQASDGKTAIAAAITGMGQAAAGTDTFAQMATKVSQISSDASATAGEVLAEKTFYQGGKRTGTMPNRSGSEYHVAAGSSINGNNLHFHIPYNGYYSTYNKIWLEEPNWQPSNIRKGTSIFGKTGTLVEGPNFTNGITWSTLGNEFATPIPNNSTYYYGFDISADGNGYYIRRALLNYSNGSLVSSEVLAYLPAPGEGFYWAPYVFRESVLVFKYNTEDGALYGTRIISYTLAGALIYDTGDIAYPTISGPGYAQLYYGYMTKQGIYVSGQYNTVGVWARNGVPLTVINLGSNVYIRNQGGGQYGYVRRSSWFQIADTKLFAELAVSNSSHNAGVLEVTLGTDGMSASATYGTWSAVNGGIGNFQNVIIGFVKKYFV